ncbi:TPA: winged helix-turn-helix domain-containing protein [Burkholderia vietnamiensis]|nr:winged helix-turn-helix domain-containing protein [Burkholderia vietnamiensis]
MAERKMGYTARLICEGLAENPNVTMAELAAKMKRTVEAIKRPLRKLIAEEYVKRGRRAKGGYLLKLTGKSYPPSGSYAPEENPEFVRRRQMEEGFSVLIPVMHAMVHSGRVSA